MPESAAEIDGVIISKTHDNDRHKVYKTAGDLK